jgi:hypothetical protein
MKTPRQLAVFSPFASISASTVAREALRLDDARLESQRAV